MAESTSTTRRRCLRCNRKVVVHWRMDCGMRTTEKVNGQECYRAKCPECGNAWDVTKQEGQQ